VGGSGAALTTKQGIVIPNRPTPSAFSSAATTDSVRVRECSYSLGGVLEGSKTWEQPTRGSCEVWDTTPSLWPQVVSALGFKISKYVLLGSTDLDLLRQVTGAHYVSGVCARRRNEAFPSTLFCDWGTLPSSTSSFWSNEAVVFVIGPSCAWAPPQGWLRHDVTVSHADVGGSTDGSFPVSMVLPVGVSERRSVWPSVASRPGGPVANSLECRVYSSVELPSPNEPPMPSRKVEWL
jgi:hypothetical protein